MTIASDDNWPHAEEEGGISENSANDEVESSDNTEELDQQSQKRRRAGDQ